VPVYRLDLADGYAEGIEHVGEGAATLFKRAAADAPLVRAQVRLREPRAADSGFNALLQAHFDALQRGETLAFTFIAAGRLDGYRFRARRVGEAPFEGHPALQLRVEPDSLLRVVVDPLLLTYEVASRRLREYRGPSNIHDPASGEAWRVRIVFSEQPPAGTPPPPSLD
jgi:hypothetical protein